MNIPACILLVGLAGLLATPTQAVALQEQSKEDTPAFYVPENPNYNIVDSVRDSLRFTMGNTLKLDLWGHLESKSSFVDPEGKVMGWHDFGNLEGPGWAANAVGGAHEAYTFGRFIGNDTWQSNALEILAHILDSGFIDVRTSFIYPYRETTTGKFCLNYKHTADWLCPGSMAKIGVQCLAFADAIPDQSLKKQLVQIALGCAKWLDQNMEEVPNGWFPRRTTADGHVYRKSPDGGNDPFWQTSADGLFIVQLQAALTHRRLANYRESIRTKADVFMRAGGIYGSINHDTYDPHENVAYSVAFRTWLPVAKLLKSTALREFCFRNCLAGLDQFKMTDDRNGVATKGLLYMEKSWDTAYLWENAEAALAFFEAALDLRRKNPGQSRTYEIDGLVILRAISKHHYGTNGFLTEGVDWNNHVGKQHHIAQTEYAAIQYTEPFLNNQHIAEPTLFYLKHLAARKKMAKTIEFRDIEGNLLLTLSRD